MAQEQVHGEQLKKINVSGFANPKKAEKEVSTKDVLDKIDAAQSAASKAGKKETRGKITAIHGASVGEHELGGLTVAQIREALRGPYNIPADAKAYMDAKEVDENTIVETNCQVEFIKIYGAKGVSPCYIRTYGE